MASTIETRTKSRVTLNCVELLVFDNFDLLRCFVIYYHILFKICPFQQLIALMFFVLQS